MMRTVRFSDSRGVVMPSPLRQTPHRQTPAPGCRMTNAFENITFPQTSFADHNNR